MGRRIVGVRREPAADGVEPAGGPPLAGGEPAAERPLEEAERPPEPAAEPVEPPVDGGLAIIVTGPDTRTMAGQPLVKWDRRGREGFDPSKLVERFLASRSQATRDAYARDLRDFARWLGAPDGATAASALLTRTQGEANALALDYLNHLRERASFNDPADRLSPATINRRLAALSSLVRLAQTVGMVSWGLTIDRLRVETYRDTAGPGLAVVQKLLRTLDAAGDMAGARDAVIIHLAFDMGLRQGEIRGLDVEHVELSKRILWILGKARLAREARTIPELTADAIRRWMPFRGIKPGPLVYSLNPRGLGARLSKSGVEYIVAERSRAVCGQHIRPHGFRHTAITTALNATGGDVRAVALFARHKDVKTTLKYDDNRRDLAGQTAELISRQAATESPEPPAEEDE